MVVVLKCTGIGGGCDLTRRMQSPMSQHGSLAGVPRPSFRKADVSTRVCPYGVFAESICVRASTASSSSAARTATSGKSRIHPAM